MGRDGQDACALNDRRWLAVLLLLAPLTAARGDSLDLRSEAEFSSAASARDPVNFVMAQAAPGAAPGRAAPGPPAASLPQAPSGFSLMRLIFQDNAENGRLRLAPMRWRGNVSVDQRFTRASDGASSSQTLEYASISVSTYISQPWLAQVSGNLGLLAAQSRDEPGSDGGPGTGRGRNVSVTGGGTLGIFPSSRFPFTATFQSSDSRTSGEVTGSDYVNRMLTLRQSYRSPLGDQVYTATLDRSSMTGSFGSDTVTSLGATMQRRYAEQVIDMAGSLSRSRRAGGGTDIGRLMGRHSYRPEEAPYTLDSYASFTMADFSALAGLRSHLFQLNSFGTWRPDEESPLFVTGGAHFADAATSGEFDGAARSAGMNLAASYALGKHAHLVGDATVGWTGGDHARVVTSQSVGANYRPPAIPLGPLSYTWGTGLAASNHTGGNEGGQQALGTSATHQVASGIELGSIAGLSGSIGQGVGWQHDSAGDPTLTLQHSASLSLRLAPTLGSNLVFTVTGGESRTSGEREERFRLLNAQLQGQLQLGVFSVFSANLTVQAIRQRGDVEGDESRTSVYRSGTLSYRHTRLFGVPRLRAVVDASFADLELESRELGDVNAPRDRVSRLYEARLEYEIGRLDFRLGTRLATIEGKSDRQVFFRVNRQFGLY